MCGSLGEELSWLSKGPKARGGLFQGQQGGCCGRSPGSRGRVEGKGAGALGVRLGKSGGSDRAESSDRVERL